MREEAQKAKNRFAAQSYFSMGLGPALCFLDRCVNAHALIILILIYMYTHTYTHILHFNALMHTFIRTQQGHGSFQGAALRDLRGSRVIRPVAVLPPLFRGHHAGEHARG